MSKKFLSGVTDQSGRQLSTEDLSTAEQQAINHANRAVLDLLGETAGALTYNGSPISGGSAPNLTLTTLTLGNYRISYNSVSNALDFEYIGV
jgi:hypothetical protein